MFYVNRTRTLLFILTTLFLGCLLIGCNDSDSDSNKNKDAETTWYKDVDGDGYGDPSISLVQAAQPAGYVNNASDCADYTADIYPGAAEECDGKDNNCNGEMDENACGLQNQKISGRITNINDALAYITGDSYLQLIAYPEDGQLPFTTDAQGKRVYTSTLPDIDMRANGTFVFETAGLPPGQYVIAAQRLEPYTPESEETTILAASGNQSAVIVVPENGNTPFEVDLGNVILPVPAPIIDNQTGPAPPTGVSASDGAFEDKIRVTWNASEGATAYEVYRAASFAGQQVKIATTAGTVHDDTNLPCGVDYYYWVRAINDSGTSDLFYNDLGFIRCPAPPVIPDDDPIEDPEDPVITEPDALNAVTGVSATDGIYPEKVKIIWNAVEGATSYEIYRHSDCCGERTKIGTTSSNFFEDTYDDSISITYTAINYYWVKAINSKTKSLYSAYDTGHKLYKPLDPTNVAASDGAFVGKVRVTWLPGKHPTPSIACGGGCGNPVMAEKIDEYEIYRANWSDGPKTLIGKTSSTWFDDFDIPCSTCENIYYYWVVAKNAAGSSQYSNGDTGYAYRTLPDPNDIRATDGTIYYCVKIRWSAIAGATSYDIFRSASLDGIKTKIGSVPADCAVCGTYSYLDTNPACPEVYYYWVKSIDSNGYTACSFNYYDTGFCKGD